MAPRTFELPVTVADGDIDELDHVNNVVYLRWVQDAAAAHWFHVVPAEAAARVVWVVRRHEIDYKAPALAGDRLVVRTWVEGWSAATSVRRCDVLRPADGRVLASARTEWVMLDRASGRPRRIADALAGLFAEPAAAAADAAGD
ncbi:MAG: acyl-CoA thioesterase [Gemmatimonadales bacterium]|nr:acyl-CoA thioesterase [Gemmatimonadales bacterium]